MTKVVVFDYGFGNVRSMVRALAHIGLDVTLTSDYGQAFEADGLAVPGVGAFAACMNGIRQAGGDRVIRERLAVGRPVLGVCVGLQIMFARGVEGREVTDGLGFIEGSVDRLEADVVPHMGWDTLEAPDGSVLFNGIEDERFYFVHSYAPSSAAIPGGRGDVLPSDAQQRVAWCTYGRSRFVAAYERGPLCATQFHPEKSGETGAKLLRNWAATL